MLKKLRARRSAVRAEIDAILAKPTEDNRSLTPEETSELTTKRAELREVESLIEMYEELADEDAADEARGDGQAAGDAGVEIRAGDTLDPGGAVRQLVGAAAARGAVADTGQAVRVTSNPLTYDRRNKQRSYLWDLARFKMGVDDTGESAGASRLSRRGDARRDAPPRGAGCSAPSTTPASTRSATTTRSPGEWCSTRSTTSAVTSPGPTARAASSCRRCGWSRTTSTSPGPGGCPRTWPARSRSRAGRTRSTSLESRPAPPRRCRPRTTPLFPRPTWRPTPCRRRCGPSLVSRTSRCSCSSSPRSRSTT